MSTCPAKTATRARGGSKRTAARGWCRSYPCQQRDRRDRSRDQAFPRFNFARCRHARRKRLRGRAAAQNGPRPAVGADRILANNGIDAIEAAIKHFPDLILLDVDMPGENGYEGARRLKTDRGPRLVPIVSLPTTGSTRSKPRSSISPI